MLYYVIISVILLLSVFCVRQNYYTNIGIRQSYSNVYVFDGMIEIGIMVVLLAIICLTGLRSFSIGNDTANYVYYFNEFKNGISIDHDFELGFQVFCYLVGRFTQNPQWFLFIYALVCYSLIGNFIIKNSKNMPFSICFMFCFFFTVYTNILRQGLALVFVLYGYGALKKKNYIYSIILFVVAGLFHKTAYFCLIILLYKLVPTNVYFVIAFTLIISALSILGLGDKLIQIVAPFYSRYFDSKYDSSGMMAVLLYLFIAIMIYLIILSGQNRQKPKNGKSPELSLSVFLIASYALAFSNNLFTRMADYFMFIMMVYLPESISKLKYSKLVYRGLAIMMVAYFFVIIVFRPSWNILAPYKFFWEEV